MKKATARKIGLLESYKSIQSLLHNQATTISDEKVRAAAIYCILNAADNVTDSRNQLELDVINGVYENQAAAEKRCLLNSIAVLAADTEVEVRRKVCAWFARRGIIL